MAYRQYLKDESGAATVDWVIILSGLVGMGLVVVDASTDALTTNSRTIQGELNNGMFETAWDDHLTVQPDGDGDGVDPNTDPTPDPDPDPDPTPDPDPDPTPDPDPDPTPDPDPDPTPDPDPDPDPTPDPDPDPDPTSYTCPTAVLNGTPASGTGTGMWSPDRYYARAGGPHHISSCSGYGNINPTGFYTAAPTYTFNISGMQNYNRLEIEVWGNCDTTLLVRDSNGKFYFDDDSRGGLQPRLSIYDLSGLDGNVDVWVGTYGSGQCDTTLEMESW